MFQNFGTTLQDMRGPEDERLEAWSHAGFRVRNLRTSGFFQDFFHVKLSEGEKPPWSTGENQKERKKHLKQKKQVVDGKKKPSH